jgi:hypothetical protein
MAVTRQRQPALLAEFPERVEVLADALVLLERDPVRVRSVDAAQDAPVDVHRMRRSIAPLIGLIRAGN